jgi:hypothetical protein
MSVEHFLAGSGDGTGGIIPPSAGPEPDVMPLRRAKPTNAVTDEERAQGIVAKEEVDETTSSALPAARVPFSGGNLAQGGQHPGQTMKTKDIHSGLASVHTILDTVARNASSLKNLHPDHQDAIIAARQHLNDAKIHLDEGHSTGVGTNRPDTAATKMSFSKAIGHISKAHNLLSEDGLQDKLSLHNLGAEIPERSTVADLQGHVGSMRGAGAGGKQGVRRSFKTVAVGRANIPTSSISQDDLEAMRKLGGKEHPLVRKVETALKGTPKDGGELVSRDNYEKARDKGQVRSSRKGLTSGPAINPKKRGTGASIRTRISSGSNVGKTPTFGESGRTGKVTGETPKNLTADPAKTNPTQNRGGKGGAV